MSIILVSILVWNFNLILKYLDFSSLSVIFAASYISYYSKVLLKPSLKTWNKNFQRPERHWHLLTQLNFVQMWMNVGHEWRKKLCGSTRIEWWLKDHALDGWQRKNWYKYIFYFWASNLVTQIFLCTRINITS